MYIEQEHIDKVEKIRKLEIELKLLNLRIEKGEKNASKFVGNLQSGKIIDPSQ